MTRFGETETQQLPTPILTEEVWVFLCPQSCMVDALPVLGGYLSIDMGVVIAI